MPTKNKRINVTPTPEFRKWLERISFLRADTSLAETLIYFAEEEIRNRGFVGPIMLARGKYKRHDGPDNDTDPDESILFDDDHPDGMACSKAR